MPLHNFMLEDLVAALLAIAIYPLFLFIPGYALAWALDLLEFRHRTIAFRIAFSIPLAIAVCPILTYLAGRSGHTYLVWWIYGLAFLYFTTVAGRRLSITFPRLPPFVLAGALVWLAVALYALVDFESGRVLYIPTGAIDHAMRSALIHSISTTGIPPENPFFWPGRGVPLRYHYFWMMMCSLVDRAGGPAVSARQALIGGTFWCGLGFLGLLAVYLRLFWRSEAAQLNRRLRIGLLLLGITGLDLLPALWFLQNHLLLPSVEHWNEFVNWFLHTTLTTPHAMASLIACLTGWLLLWHAPDAGGRSPLVRYSIPAGLALSSAVGSSVYVSLVFAVFLILWTAITLWKKWRRETLTLLVAGLVAIPPSLLFLRDLSGPGRGGPFVQWTIRPFLFADYNFLPKWPDLAPALRAFLVNLPLLPFNYGLEFGFFFVAGWIQLGKYRRLRGKLSREEAAFLLLFGTSLLMATFLRSGVIENNDLGWRGLLPAEFVLLLWAVNMMAGWSRPNYLSEIQRLILFVCLVIGAGGTIYDLVASRIYPMLADRGLIPRLGWMAPDRQCGLRTYANRAAYAWAQQAVPATGVIQANPKVVVQETFSMYYSERRNIAADMTCLAVFGGDPAECTPIAARLQQIYPPAGRPAPAGLRETCESLPADLLVAKDTDAVWSDRSSWVWKEKPVYSNAYVRLFRCRAAGQTPR